MSVDIARRTQFSGAPARSGGARLPEPQISAEAARMDKLDNDQFEKKGLELAKPTLARPALITTAEVDAIRAGYATGAGRLDVINKVTNKRLDYYTESTGGGAPFDPISEGDRAKCAKFFGEHGTRLLDQPRQAPPNPLRKPDPAAVLAGARVDLTQSAANAAADQAIVESERAPKPQLPEPKPVAPEPMPIALPPQATLDIEFLSEQGYHCRLHLQAPSWAAVLDHLGKATGRLAAMKAKPIPAPALAAQAKTAGDAASAPTCPVHHKRMKKSKRPRTWFCSVKDPDTEEYCEEKFIEPA